MALLPKRWTLNRLRDRLERVERAKDEAMQALVVRDEMLDERSRFDYQDPGQVGTMLDEIASLQHRIAHLEDPESEAAQDADPRGEPAVPEGGALMPAFAILRAELNQIQRASLTGRIGVDELRQAMRVALTDDAVLDAAFQGLRAEMTHMQRANLPGRIGIDALRQALRVGLTGRDEATRWTGRWPETGKPGMPAAPDMDGWHWVRAPGKPLVVLSWHAETRCWGHRLGITPGKAVADGLRYYGPCAQPLSDNDHDAMPRHGRAMSE